MNQPTMKTIHLSLRILAAVVGLNTAMATTVIPPAFNELVDQAQVIFQGTVTDVQCRWAGEGSQRHIVSDVTFLIEDPIKGEPGLSYTMRMLGGTIDGETMGIAEAPTFKRGDRDIVFIENNGSQFIPLVGIMHGRFRIRPGSIVGREIVTRNNGGPVGGVAGLGATEFKAAIRARLAAASH